MNFNLNNFNLNDRNILLLGIVGIAVVALLAYFLLIGPLLGRLSAGAEERDSKEAQLTQLQGQVQGLESVRRNSGQIDQQLLQLDKRVPQNPEIPTLVVQIQEVARAAGVTQLSIEPGTPGPPEGGGPYSVVPVKMSFEGTYQGMQDFMTRTQDLARLVTIDRVSYAQAEGTTGGGTTGASGVEPTLRVEVEAEVYFQGASGGLTTGGLTTGGSTTGATSSGSTTTTTTEATTGG